VGGIVAVPGSDTAQQDALNCASVKLCGSWGQFRLTTLSVWVDHFRLSVMCTPRNLKLFTFSAAVPSVDRDVLPLLFPEVHNQLLRFVDVLVTW
jgi:hypothetical protein